MRASKLLLDTNAYTGWKKGHAGVAGLVRDATRLAFSSIVMGELLYGFRCGTRYRENLLELKELLADPSCELVVVTETTADRYARVMQSLRRKGKPIPTNDAWIAAQALEHGAELASFDDHFDSVEGLVTIALEKESHA